MYPGVADMLDELTAAGHTLSIATAKPEPTARRIIEHFGFSGYFEVQAGASVEVGVGPTNEGPGHRLRTDPASAHTGRSRPQVVMVGDRDHDVEGAHLNHIDCIGVTWGFGSAAELSGAGAAAIVDHPGEVAAAVEATYRSVRP